MSFFFPMIGFIGGCNICIKMMEAAGFSKILPILIASPVYGLIIAYMANRKGKLLDFKISILVLMAACMLVDGYRLVSYAFSHVPNQNSNIADVVAITSLAFLLGFLNQIKETDQALGVLVSTHSSDDER